MTGWRLRALAAGVMLAGAVLAACTSEQRLEVSSGPPGDRATTTTGAVTSSSTDPALATTTTTTTSTVPRRTTTTTTATTTTPPAAPEPACAPTGTFGPYVFDTHLDGDDGLAAGTATIRATTDGGATWTVACLPEDLHGSVLALAMRGTNAWAVGIEGPSSFILRSTDGGKRWRRVPNPVATSALADVAFTDDDHGVAVGRRPQSDPAYGPKYGAGALILRTVDGGATWTVAADLDPDVAAGLNRLSFTDPAHGWASGQTRGNAPVLMATTDGGATWEPRALPGEVREIHDVAFVDRERGWITAETGEPSPGGQRGAIFATADGGATWTPQWQATQTGLTTGLAFVDAGHGWAVTNPPAGGTVLATSDGGATWTATLTPGRSLTTTSFTDAHHGWVAGMQGGTVYVTADGGSTLEPRLIG